MEPIHIKELFMIYLQSLNESSNNFWVAQISYQRYFQEIQQLVQSSVQKKAVLLWYLTQWIDEIILMKLYLTYQIQIFYIWMETTKMQKKFHYFLSQPQFQLSKI
ncbi:unnamed protein product [Paramecium octaurelia]|uniref:Uncharacterized protein n=1 Tax=Paramecium octaurelia TaxID=43137 RepID=A0A8S1S0H4_PAROT|nr:unnamed protein product [Paramecium octaurelia]